MKVYLDLLFLLNFGFDFLLLLSVSYLLRRFASIKRIFLGALVGGLSIFLLFLKMNSITLFLWKFGISILMLLITFGYSDLVYFFHNFCYLYSISIVLGGILYFLNVTFSYRQEGLVFYHSGLSINAFLLISLSPIFLFFYLKQLKRLKNHYAHYYDVSIEIDHFSYHFHGFLDTGNHLKDPYSGKPILLVFSKKLSANIIDPIFVPYETVSGSSLLKCIRCSKITIAGIGESKNLLVGLLDHKVGIDGIDCILQERILEGSYVS